MGRQKEPINLIVAKGKKHLTKEEIRERRASEIRPIADNIVAPGFLTKKQKAEFYKIAEQLQKLEIMGETDVDALGRYIASNESYITATQKLRTSEVKNDPYLYDIWSKIQDRYFKQVRACATDLGLTISSRCKLEIPHVEGDQPRRDKFAKFEKRAI